MDGGAKLRLRLNGAMGREQPKRSYGRIWPNGEFSLGVGPLGSAAAELEGAEVVDLARYGAAGDLAAAVAALTSSNASNSHTPPSARPQRGLGGLTAYGAKMLRSACYVMERDYGRGDLCFATLTVPTLSRSGRRALAQNWSVLVNRLTQWVARRLIAAGRPTKVAGCVEIQTGRLAARGEAYLHLHVVWPAHSNAAGERWAVGWEDLREWWGRSLERYSGEIISHKPRVELAPVRKSAERYMAKYLSKGGGEALDEYILDLGAESVPSTWWFMSADLRQKVKSETASGPNTGTLLDAVIQCCFEEGDLSPFEWIRHVEMPMGDRMVTVGWVGRLRRRERDDLLTLLSPLM